MKLVTKIKNRQDKKKYIIQTEKSITGYWETAVFGTYLFGLFKGSVPLVLIRNRKQVDAEKAHENLEVIVGLHHRSSW